MAIGGNFRYPTLQNICDLFRSQVNDDFAGDTGTPGEGLVNFNTATHVLTFLNSAVRDTYSDLRNVGDPELLLDNYIVYSLPPLAAPDPAVQVSLDSTGYFDGFMFHSEFTLPANCMKVEKVWERWSNNDGVFVPMTPMPSGIAGTFQTQRMGVWEMRQNAIWMPGALLPIDLRIRCRITFPDYFNPATIDFTTTYVPILDCTNAVVDKMCVRYARRFAPDLYATSVDAADKSLQKLRLEVVRQMQNTQYGRSEYGEAATAPFNWQWYGL